MPETYDQVTEAVPKLNGNAATDNHNIIFTYKPQHNDANKVYSHTFWKKSFVFCLRNFWLMSSNFIHKSPNKSTFSQLVYSFVLYKRQTIALITCISGVFESKANKNRNKVNLKNINFF